MRTIALAELSEKSLWGRCGTKDGAPVLFHAGSGVELRVQGGELWAEIEAEYEAMELWLDVFLDDERQMRFPLARGRNRYLMFRGLDPVTPVTVRIARNTQSMPGESDRVSLITVHSVETDGCFLPVKKRPHRLVFIGDSITSGEGCGSTTREEWVPLVFDAAENYVRYSADALNAEYTAISQSGWGLYASWDGNRENVLPKVYPLVCGSQNSAAALAAGAGRAWDFSGDETEAVIINLGTNDSSALISAGEAAEEFRENFLAAGVAFSEQLRSVHPKAYLLWAYGMLGQNMAPLLQEIVNRYREKTGDGRASFLLLPDSSDGCMGVRNHPNPAGHRMAAEVLAEELKKMLW